MMALHGLVFFFREKGAMLHPCYIEDLTRVIISYAIY